MQPYNTGIQMPENESERKAPELKTLLVLALTAGLLSSCAAAAIQARPVAPEATQSATVTRAVVPSSTPPSTSTPQITATPATYGPDMDGFPVGINPLSGQPAEDPSLLKIPAVLVSISHFPATGRPQAGLSFAPFVYEFSITGGESRFLAAFYGAYPQPEVPIRGDCAIRAGAFELSGTLLGNRVWLDTNANGYQDPGEDGIPGVCVDLLSAQGQLLDSTTTDSNGMYGFSVLPERRYVLAFRKPMHLAFTKRDVGLDDKDSDVDPPSGRTAEVLVGRDTRDWDAGLVPDELNPPPTPLPEGWPRPEVGPVRSGRLHYTYLNASYHNSCLIFAFASRENLEKIPLCASVPHEEVGGGEMLTVDRLVAVAEDNARHTAGSSFNYSSNRYTESPPSGGTAASQINVFFSTLNQSGWTYDPLYQAYLRYVDSADKNAPGVLHPDVDRLTGRQLHVENVVLIMVDTDVVSATNLNIRLDEGNTGPGTLFRNGQAFPIKWSTRAGEYERKTGFRRPIQFLNPDGSAAVLKPGHTWVLMMTPYSLVEQKAGVHWIRYGAPEGEAR
jgi:SdrD B-like domain/Protein of unknown function (DUF3048) C-terminal domain